MDLEKNSLSRECHKTSRGYDFLYIQNNIAQRKAAGQNKYIVASQTLTLYVLG